MKIIILSIILSFSIPLENITNGVYNFQIDKNKFLVFEKGKLKIGNSKKCQKESNFRIKIKSIYNIFYIEHKQTNFKLTVTKSDLTISINNDSNISDEWSFINLKKNKYSILNNNNKCYLILKRKKIICQKSKIEYALKLNLIKIYEEVNNSKEDIAIIEKEPIDVLIKYIDLSDASLIRDGIPQIKKEESNDEIKYNIRSILKNIPWVRKIFILMPNKKVKFLKEYDLIKEKIIYVYDKDILGYDSANSLAFQFSSWMMKKFNMSKNYILMDDDYFIGKPLKKADFFYIQNGEVVPSIVSNDFIELNEKSAKKKHNEYKKKIKASQSSAHFLYSIYTSYLFTMKLLSYKLNKSFIFPIFTHNAISCNAKDVEEIYYLVYNSNYKYSTLEALYRHTESIQFHSFLLAYTFIKYNKKVNPISYNYIENDKSLFSQYNFSLFCINTGARQYSPLSFMKSKLVMEMLFPEPTPYEINNNSYISNLAFNTIYQIELQNIKKMKIIKIIFLVFGIFIISFIIYFIIIIFLLKIIVFI